MKRILEIQDNQNVDLTNGFKRKRSTVSLLLTIQTIIAQALHEENYAITASLDLRAKSL